jgi:integrase
MANKQIAVEGHPGLFRREGCDNIYLQFYDATGKRHRESCGTGDLVKAQRRLNLKRGQVEAGTYQERRNVTVAQAVQDLISWYRTTALKDERAKAVESYWRMHLEPFFGHMKVEKVTRSVLESYRKRRMEQLHAVPDEEHPGQLKLVAPSPTTVNRELQCIRRAFKHGKIATPEFPMASEAGNARQRFASAEEIERLRRAAAEHSIWMRFLVEMCYTVGWRKSEVMELTVEDVHLAEARPFIRSHTRTKNGKFKECPLISSLLVLAQALVGDARRDGRTQLLPVGDPRKAWARVCRIAGLQNLHLHDGRRSAARRSRAAGVSEHVVMAQLGWSSPAMFQRYDIVSQADIADGLARTAAFESSPTTIEHSPTYSPTDESANLSYSFCKTGA